MGSDERQKNYRESCVMEFGSEAKDPLTLPAVMTGGETVGCGGFASHDDTPLDRVVLRDAPFHPKPFVVYHVRAESQLNQTQWSSPIWLDLEDSVTNRTA